MAGFIDLVMKKVDLTEAVKATLKERAVHVLKNVDVKSVLNEARIDEANIIPSKREMNVAFATAHYNKLHGTNFPKHDVHAHLYGGEAPEFAAHVEANANPESADHLEKNFGLNKNSFMEGENEQIDYTVVEMEDAPDNAIPPLSKEAVKKILTTYQFRDLPSEYNLDSYLPKDPQGQARASATSGEDVPAVAPPAGPTPTDHDVYKSWFTK